MYSHGFIKVAAASPVLKTGDAMANVKEILNLLKEVEKKNVSIVVFPEMCICGYSIGDLVFQDYLYRDNLVALKYLRDNNTFKGVAIVGTFFKINDRIYNCSVVLQQHKILGIVPKRYLPHTNEFYEARWYVPGNNVQVDEINLFGEMVPFGRMVFVNEDKRVQFGCEICEDLWAPMPPHETLYANGAILVFNSSASPEVVGKDDKRRMMVEAASYKCNGAYIYTSNNASESTSEVVFSNHKLIVENGDIVSEAHKIDLDNDLLVGDIDVSKLHHCRQTNGWVKNIESQHYDILRKVSYDLEESEDFIFEKDLDVLPFVPKCKEDYQKIIDIQATSVMKRLNYIGIKKAILGVSGGLDSTLALLSLCHMCDKYNIDRKNIIALTLPSINNSSTTYNNSIELMKRLKVNYREINIKEDVMRQLKAIGHDMTTKDVTYENVQARFRTYTLMNTANLEGGIVIGTSDMSEVALGWSTFNGDQMAMYGINCGLPKTVIKATTRYYKEIYPEVSDIIDSVLDTPISPELTGNNQLTEDIIGKYEVNDFILYHFLVNGDSDERLVYLLTKFMKLSKDKATEYVNNFNRRFYRQQFKRLTMPEGVKILNLSLSPRTETRLNGDIYKPNNK